LQPVEQNRNDSHEDGFLRQIVTRPLDELRPHPSYVTHGLSVSASQLSTLAALGRLAFREPIVITQEGVIIDGYAQWELARRQGRQTIQFRLLPMPLKDCLEEIESAPWAHSSSTAREIDF